MLSNAYLLAKIGADTAENEQHFAERDEHRRVPRRGDGRRAAAVAAWREEELLREEVFRRKSSRTPQLK